MINSRQKGARGERLWRDKLREAGFASAIRGQQFSGGADSPDVKCDDIPDIHFEVKFVEHLNIETAMEQSIRDSKGKTPVVSHKRCRSDWLVTMRANDWLNLIKESHFPRVG